MNHLPDIKSLDVEKNWEVFTVSVKFMLVILYILHDTCMV